MQNLIYKKLLSTANIGTPQAIQLPKHAQILDAQFQNNELVLWAQFEEEFYNVPQHRQIIVAFTGKIFSVAEGYFTQHVATVQHEGLVYHVFELHKIEEWQ